jgi:hypothetical protein
MRSRLRAWIGLATLAALGAGLGGQLGVHAHALGETDLVPHALVAIDHAPSPRAAAHFDRAVEAEHPVCQDCLLASLRTDVAGAPPAAFGLDFAGPSVRPPDAAAPFRLVERRAPARAPPAA